MKYCVLTFISLIISFHSYGQIEKYNLLLKENVDSDGKINYESIKKDSSNLHSYLTYLANTSPDSTWNDDMKKAFWLNAYNAYTIKIIVDNYPPKNLSVEKEKTGSEGHNVGFTITNVKMPSIMYIQKEGKDAWNIPFANVGGKIYTLNQIEHGIIRKKFSDGRIHAGLNAASISGPTFVNYAFTQENINESLESLIKSFINDSSKNKISKDAVVLSKVFEWYPEDFNMGDILMFINKYSNVEVAPDASVKFLEYNWDLNYKNEQ
ncbi:DUF547 domain-containing protein [Tenacibaculum amylolyticum]|uniref:DUF547 domain-containing protein n=1 Tax=Tenacibaculum amylolyticum TaxID=104269 RepID=UPI0038946429